MAVKRDNIDLIVSASELTSLFDKKSSLSTLLQDIAEMVAEHMAADVCSIYLYDQLQRELVLRATIGLARSSIGRVKLKPGEGITGIALKELRPVREARATKNPAYKYFENIEEEKYEAFLAVPIKKGLNRIGVITLQHRQPDYFSKRDTAALKAIASQLAASIENSQMLIGLRAGKTGADDFSNLMIQGTGRGSTTAIGRAYILSSRGKAYNKRPGGKKPFSPEGADKIDVNIAAFDSALELSMNQLEELQFNVDDSLSDVAGMIFTAHFLMLRDENYTGEMRNLITTGHCPDDAVRQITAQYVDIFEGSDMPGIQEKVQDIKDLEHRLLANLYGKSFESADYSANIIISDDIFPSELVKIWLQKARGLVLYGSGVTAHISILARSLGLPLFMTDDRRVMSISEDAELILDSRSSHLYINPSDEIKVSYKTATAAEAVAVKEDIPGQITTTDGTGLKIQANINIIHDVDAAMDVKADGIGLYRSEFPFIIRNEFPSEEEQFRIYQKILRMNKVGECIFRTLDIGGDKMPGYASLKAEANPFLGFRGIRFSLGHPEVFQEQIRAMLRAGAGRDLKIMFPMVSSMDEFNKAKEIVAECIISLESEGSELNSSPLIGAMVEVPAAVGIIDNLSAAADFLSIGTNDLVMYTLAVDRTNERVRGMYKPWHPAVLRSLQTVAESAVINATELSVCGEAASDSNMMKFLIGIGVRKFSVDPLKIPGMKRFASELSVSDCRSFAEKALAAETVKAADSLFCC
ncbi:MAG: phosphoenolpyruvate--protein phosphotransferase [Spirochaetales bacterium]|uniref:Phosphoenolpyruvate-protein phosphotransferase n=1 Tax=Candidatus Thalassospirochaeta sargassi TaxID=3119039 RepID=A0AAJ1IFJ0_9SPIO|nr:phosphoenolpyruvate--protein phosphotransferase [Spirochaetales bacterium]